MGWGYDDKANSLFGSAENQPQQTAAFAPLSTSTNLMNDGANDIEMMQDRELATVGSSTTQEDVEYAISLAQRTVAAMMAQGASDEEIRQAVANLPISPEHMQVAQTAADKQLETDKFNIFSSRNEEQGQDQGIAFVGNVVSSLLGASAAQAQQTGLGQGVTGGDNVSLAMLGDLVPLQTPGQQREREMGLFA